MPSTRPRHPKTSSASGAPFQYSLPNAVNRITVLSCILHYLRISESAWKVYGQHLICNAKCCQAGYLQPSIHAHHGCERSPYGAAETGWTRTNRRPRTRAQVFSPRTPPWRLCTCSPTSLTCPLTAHSPAATSPSLTATTTATRCAPCAVYSLTPLHCSLQADHAWSAPVRVAPYGDGLQGREA
jgi:hypothetical protein